MKGFGLVFAGGGGKGAYEVGVWKYLHEIGLDQYVRCVSGTSVGALNAALFVGSSYELAEELWLNITEDKILTPKKITVEEIMQWLTSHGFHFAGPLTMGMSKIASGTIWGVEKVAQMMLTKMKGDHMFSRDGMIDMISDGLNFIMLQTSDIPCYVTCVKCSGLEVERFKLNDYSDTDIRTLLLATSAIPVIFQNEKFHGSSYCDGGIPVVGDNVPIAPVYDTGVENIIVIHLNRDTVIDKSKFTNAKIIEIMPKDDLGNAINGTLDFSPEGASYRMKLGYEDAKRIMQPMVDIIVMAIDGQRMLKVARQKNMEFENKRQDLLNIDFELKEKMTSDGFDKVYAELTKEN